jgi:hypothetical protein
MRALERKANIDMNFFKRAGYPQKYFLLDIAATPLILVSTLKLAGDRDILPVNLIFEYYEWYLIGVGLVLLAPGVIFTARRKKLESDEI